ncbi:HAD family hydrolase [Deinococcus lacus]|uniref:HAD family hydrolase n=1 Tax=Deinococcus lacus TaxID=392561 RepID=A0ABW1Y9I6_9DEIO
MIRGVLFDRDDTLAYTDPEVYREAAQWLAQRFALDEAASLQALRQQWQERALTWWHLRTPEDETVFWEGYGEELAERLGLGPQHGPELMATYPYERAMRLLPGAREVLLALRARGLKTGVLSNTLPSVGRTLEHLGIDDLIDVAVASCELGVHKPEAGAFRAALERMQLTAPEVLFVDDKAENVAAARALGMPAGLISHADGPADFSSLHDVLAWVERQT